MPDLGALPGGAPAAPERIEVVFAEEDGEYRARPGCRPERNTVLLLGCPSVPPAGWWCGTTGPVPSRLVERWKRSWMRLHPGEVQAGGWRVEALSDVVRRLREAMPEVVGRPRLIAIDGRGGAGKSTLVELLRTVLPSSGVVHTDDIAWNHAYFDWGDLVVENVLRPLHRGEAVEFRPPAWIEHHRPGTIHVPAGVDAVWVEGTGIIREEFAPWFDASIWVQGDLDEQNRRLTARDGDSDAQRRHVAAWLAEELPLLLREQPWRKATIVVAGTTELHHDPATEIVVATPTTP